MATKDAIDNWMGEYGITLSERAYRELLAVNGVVETPRQLLIGMDELEVEHDNAIIGHMVDATDADATEVMMSRERSDFTWIRLANGELLLACHPTGDLYEKMSQRPGMV